MHSLCSCAILIKITQDAAPKNAECHYVPRSRHAPPSILTLWCLLPPYIHTGRTLYLFLVPKDETGVYMIRLFTSNLYCICLDTQLHWLAAWHAGKSDDLSSVWPGFVAGECLSTLVERLPDLSKFPAKIPHYHWGSWTWYMISCVWCQDWSNCAWSLRAPKWAMATVSWTYLMYPASWGSNYTWI